MYIFYIYICCVYVCIYIICIYIYILYCCGMQYQKVARCTTEISWFIVKFTLPYYNYSYTVHVKLAWILSYQSHHGWYYIHKFNWCLSRKKRWISTGDETIKTWPVGRGAVFLGDVFFRLVIFLLFKLFDKIIQNSWGNPGVILQEFDPKPSATWILGIRSCTWYKSNGGSPVLYSKCRNNGCLKNKAPHSVHWFIICLSHSNGHQT